MTNIDGGKVNILNNTADRDRQLANDFIPYVTAHMDSNNIELGDLTILDYGCGEGNITSYLAELLKLQKTLLT